MKKIPEQVYLSKEEYLEILEAMAILGCISGRSEKREDMDNRAYSLAIACAETNMTERLSSVRKILLELITPEELSELNDSGIFEEYEEPQMPYDADFQHYVRQRIPRCGSIFICFNGCFCEKDDNNTKGKRVNKLFC